MSHPVYHQRRWKAVRARVLARDGYICQIRADGCTGRATEVDHIVPLLAGGDRFEETNLRAACKRCNFNRREGGPRPSREW